MSHKISIASNSLEFNSDESDNILSAALNAGINLPHSCKDGCCSACKCKMISGTVTHDKYSSSALSDDEVADNYILTCKSHATSDIVLDLPGFINGFPIKTLPAKIESLDKHGTVAIIKLKLPANQVFDFYAGQYIDILFDGKNRSYSLANSPTEIGILELHIRYREGGAFSEMVWNKLAANQILRFKGPLGSFTLQNKSEAPILMVCTGTGFAPIKSLIEYMIATKNSRQVTLVWGNYVPEDFYLTELISTWQQQLNLNVQLCSNERTPAGYFHGLVTEYVQQNFTDLSEYELYTCGHPGMIENLYNLASTELKLVKTNFHSDVFSPSK
jgi:CDP-4-dehydro-6-deoxyglucose reductase